MRSLGIILAGGKSERLGELTDIRASSALPVGGSYRAIDFPLSNMSNSGINKVAVITQFNSRSLHDHLSSAKWWDLGRKHGGLFVFTPFLSNEASYWFRGTADSIYQNMAFLKRSNEPYVVIAAGEGIYKIDYNKIVEYHIEKDADITIVCKDMHNLDVHDFGVVNIDEHDRLTDFEEKPVDPQSSIISLGIYVLSRNLLIKLLETAVSDARYDFVKDIIVRYRKKIKMYAYMFDGYWSTINCVKRYYQTNMDFLRHDVRQTFLKEWPFIETKPKDEPPAKYNVGACVKDCIVGSGSILNGYINRSVLFRKVFTGENTNISDSVIMEGCFIGNNCTIRNAILDKEVILSDGKNIIGTPENPMIVKKGTLI